MKIKRKCLERTEIATDIFIDPIVRLNQSTVFLTCDYDQPVRRERIRLDISMMRWKPKQPDQQKQGERMSVF